MNSLPTATDIMPQQLRPPHKPEHVNTAYQLRYTWTGWPAHCEHLPSEPNTQFFQDYCRALRRDEIRLLQHRWSPEEVQILISLTPETSPTDLAKSVSGRLNHELRRHEIDASFRNKFAVRAVGDTRRAQIEAYIDRQVRDRGYCSKKFTRRLERFTITNPDVDLSSPRRTKRGSYWHCLHLVFVVDDNLRVTDRHRLARIKNTCLAVARKHDHELGRLSVMPDHTHLAVAPPPGSSPKQAGMAYLNNLCHQMGNGLWKPSFYVGAFSEYDMNAIRRQSR